MLAAADNLQLVQNLDRSTGRRYYAGQTAQVARYAAGYGTYQAPAPLGTWRATRGTNRVPMSHASRGVRKLQGLGCGCGCESPVQQLGAIDWSTDGLRYLAWGAGALLLLSVLRRR